MSNTTKEDILIVALHLFARDGYEAVSVSQIAGELGMTKGALYRHYESKRDIFDHIVKRMEQGDGEQAEEYDMPADKKEKKDILENLKNETRTIILYEAPHHLVRTLDELYEALGNRRLTLCRELTKKFEEITPTTLEDARAAFENDSPRGEYVLVIEGKSLAEVKKEQEQDWQSISIEEHMQIYESQGTDRKEAMKKVAKDRGISKREVYQYLVNT